jgi:hypothetical protein
VRACWGNRHANLRFPCSLDSRDGEVMRSEPAVPGQAVKVIRPEGGISGESRAVMGFRTLATSLRCTRQPQPAPKPTEDYVPKIKFGELIPHRRYWITFLQSSLNPLTRADVVTYYATLG